MRDELVPIEVKAGATLCARHFQSPLGYAIRVAVEERPDFDGPMTFTSGTDSHEAGKHPEGDAIDLRGKNIKAASVEERRAKGRAWGARVQARVGADFDVLWEEHADPDRDHLHLEHQPKVRIRLAQGFYDRILRCMSVEPRRGAP